MHTYIYLYIYISIYTLWTCPATLMTRSGKGPFANLPTIAFYTLMIQFQMPIARLATANTAMIKLYHKICHCKVVYTQTLNSQMLDLFVLRNKLYLMELYSDCVGTLFMSLQQIALSLSVCPFLGALRFAMTSMYSRPSNPL